MDKLNFIQWNVRSIKSNRLFLKTLLFDHKIHCGLISEDWLKPTENFVIKGYDTIRSDRIDGYGGTCLLIKHPIKYTKIDCTNLNNQKIQISAIILHLDNKNITIASIYTSPNIISHETNGYVYFRNSNIQS